MTPRRNPAKMRFDPVHPKVFLMVQPPRRGRFKRREASDEPSHEESGERRIVTALFCDVTGSTTMAEQLDPEDWTEIMNEAYACMMGPVERYGGKTIRLMGDAILALFGAPNAHEDDPERAVRAALAIVEGVGPLRDELKEDLGFDFNVRVGINTGPVVAGDVGSIVGTEYTIMGDAVNLAARMEQTAVPGSVQIAENTHRQVAELFEFEPLGKMQVKGKTEPVHAYRVLAPKAAPGRTRGIRGLDAPVVGRDEEVAALREAVEAVRAGNGRIVTLLGEAGVGKSRLIAEAHALWDEPGTWTEARGIAYDMNRPYGMFIQVVHSLLGGADDDAPDVLRTKIETALPELSPLDLDHAVQAVQALLSVDEEGTTLQGEALKRELGSAMSGIWRRRAAVTPQVLVMDDLHWSDTASADLLIDLMSVADDAPVLFLCASRPEEDSPGTLVRNAAREQHGERLTAIELDALEASETQELVDRLLVDVDVPDGVRQMILDKTEGNPFFVEEVVRSLIASGAIVWDGSGMRWVGAKGVDNAGVPDNVQALLQARIDRLDVDRRQTLQVASVIGRYFGYDLLGRVADAGAVLDTQLDALEDADLIAPLADQAEREYQFRHELVRQAAYDSLLKRRRARLHRQVGLAMEEVYADQLDEQAHRLARHFAEANDDERALRYWTMAGDAAARLYANEEAAAHYARAVEVALRAPEIDSERVVQLHVKRGRTLELAGRADEALEGYRKLEELGKERGDGTLELGGLVSQATLYSGLYEGANVTLGRETAERALVLAEELGDPRAQAKCWWVLMFGSYYSGADSKETIAYGQRSIEVARANGLREELAFALNDLARPLIESGQVEQGVGMLEEAAVLWRELNNLPMLADNLDSTATYLGFGGDYEAAVRLEEQALSINRSIGNVWGEAGAMYTSSFLELELGNYAEAMEGFTQVGEQGVKAGFGAAVAMSCMMRSFAFASLGKREQVLAEVNLGLSRLKAADWVRPLRRFLDILRALYVDEKALNDDEVRSLFEEMEGAKLNRLIEFLYLLTADIAQQRGLYAELLKLAASMVEMKRRDGTKIGFADMLYLRGAAYEGLGQPDAARADYDEAVKIGGELKLRRTMWPILARLAALEEVAGDSVLASEHRAQARAIIDHIAANVGSPEFAGSFVAQPEVRAVLEG